ncbi:hypothetical protein FIBSPDRAFT_960598 [Athelia psychrophila]|uniref:Uncharacterized protein n=1 Tax=Athelia psychrophila TaxID=1759441 RepID=A0A166C9N6_9AGAM|nr:hypothetical protein FIBSPDRAFT_960598 [Fibularhizoctonia sp. CBS 109695]
MGLPKQRYLEQGTPEHGAEQHAVFAYYVEAAAVAASQYLEPHEGRMRCGRRRGLRRLLVVLVAWGLPWPLLSLPELRLRSAEVVTSEYRTRRRVVVTAA